MLSFERLAYRVFDELGTRRTVMEETGKSLLLRRIALQHADELTLLRRNLTKMGSVDELKSVLSELMQYEISPEDLEEFLATLPPENSLTYKLRDIQILYRAFNQYLADGYVTAERVLDVLTEVAGESDLLSGAVLFFDGYTGFTPVQMKLLARLMPLVSEIYVSVTLDGEEALLAPARMEDLFYMSHKMVNALCDAARDMGCPIGDPIRLDAHEKSRFADNPVLAHLERHLFRTPARTYTEDCDAHLRVVSLPSPREELSYAAAAIREIVRERGYRYGDCAIVCGDVQAYAAYADSVFSRYDIPAFVDTKRTVLYHPLTELVRAILEMANTDNAPDSVFRLLRTGLAGFAPEEVDRLENYCVEMGVRGRARWRKEFTRLPAPHGRHRPDPEAAAEELTAVNDLRARLVDLTDATGRALRKKGSTVRERTRALYDFLVRLSVEDQLRVQAEQFEEADDPEMAEVSRQIYRIVIDLMDKMVDLLGDEVLSPEDYTEILAAGLSAARVGTLPPAGDCVIVGDIERTRLTHVKCLFFLGVNDGQVPKKSRRASILSPYDREVLAEHALTLAPGEREEMFLQRFYLYWALTKPSDMLVLTYSRMDAEGQAVRPSYLIATVERLFPRLTVTEIATREMLPIATPQGSVESYLTGLVAADGGEMTPRWRALHAWYQAHAPYDARIGALFDAHFSVHRDEALDEALARTLFGVALRQSVSRLECFGDCAYRHFLQYGLELAERPEATFAPTDQGTLFHGVLERYGRRADAAGGWETLNDEQQDTFLREALREEITDLSQESLTETATGTAALGRVYRVLRRSVWAITEQIRRGEFRPDGYEVSFFNAPDTRRGGTELVGFVDRMDTRVAADRVSVRVIDYKSGSTELDLNNVYYGRQLQLPVYLHTAISILAERYPGREIVPAGLFYEHLDDPMVEAEDEVEVQDALLQALMPSGLVSADPDISLAMDRTLEPAQKSNVAPLARNKDGSLKKRADNVPPERFADLTAYAMGVIDTATRRMREGDIAAHPYHRGQTTGCDYCPYRGVCGFDPRIEGYTYREEQTMRPEEAWTAIRERLEEANGNHETPETE